MNPNSQQDKSPFRRKSLERLSSPEQLDKLMVVIGTKGWLALWCMILLIAAGIIWAFFGSIPIQVKGLGVILTEEGLFSVQSPIEGVVLEIYVKTGQLITKNTLIAKLSNSDISSKLHQTELRVKSLRDILEKLKPREGPERPVVQPVILALTRQLNDALEQLSELQKQSAYQEIYSQVEGSILEIDIAPGDIVKPGQLIAWLSLPLKPGETYLCYAYLPIVDGEKVKHGMGAEIALANVNTDNYGYLIGAVDSISVFPTSDQEMLQRVRNPQLVSYLKQGETAVIATTIKPFKDASTSSGYRWSSITGPPYPIRAGTTCSVSIMIEIRRPISYMFPFLNIQAKPAQDDNDVQKIPPVHQT